MTKNIKSHTYGPVPSRRLGFSLGIDILPFKTCSFDCIYCQLGKTPRKTIKRKKLIPETRILPQVKKALSSGLRIDAITFSGGGEPTLHTGIGSLIRKIKKTTPVPVVVLTNSSLLSQKTARKELLAADIVVPSLDAADQKTFHKINRPHPSLHVKEIVRGLKEFRKEFDGQIWLEVMLVKGVNDSRAHLEKLSQIISLIKPDRIQLNTVVRPPAEKSVRALNLKELEEVKRWLPKNSEIIASFKKKRQAPLRTKRKGRIEAILSLLRRRPVTAKDLSCFLGISQDEVLKDLDILLSKGRINMAKAKGKSYYEVNRYLPKEKKLQRKQK